MIQEDLSCVSDRQFSHHFHPDLDSEEGDNTLSIQETHGT